ncbi:MAG: carboxypeptidase regulatory-like domain-containing protein [Myxococcales bacterium]|nr:carboxypeptidase regulatory-like domain-containing protein [Myxococcales bacterium]
MRSRSLHLLALVATIALAATVGCSEQDAAAPKGLGGIDEPRCAAGKRWAGVHTSWVGNAPIAWDGVHQRSLDMHPGRNCLGCHALSGSPQIPQLIVAGTIYGAPGQANDCYGVPNVEVAITDATGTTYRVLTTIAGNFRLERDKAPGFKLPYTAAIRANGREIRMPDPQVVGSCNFCHTRDGQLGANGRIVAPGPGSDAGTPAPDSAPPDAGADGPARDGGPSADSTRDARPQRDSTRDTQPLADSTRDVGTPDQCTAGGFGAPCTTATDCCSRLCSGPPFSKTCR